MIAIDLKPKMVEKYPYTPCSIKYFDFLAESPKIVYGTDDGNVNIYNLQKMHARTLHRTKDGHICALSVARPENLIAFCYDSNYLILGKYDKGEFRSNKLPGTLKSILSLNFNCNSSQLATGSADKSLKIYDTQKLKFVGSLLGHRSWVSSIQYSPFDQDILISGSNDGRIKQWDTRCKTMIDQFDLPTEIPISSIANVEYLNEPFLLSVTSNSIDRKTNLDYGNFQVFDLRNSKLLQHYSESRNNFICTSVQKNDPNSEYCSPVVSLLDSKSIIHVIDISIGSCIYKIVQNPKQHIRSMKYSPQERSMLFTAICNSNSLFQKWNIVDPSRGVTIL